MKDYEKASKEAKKEFNKVVKEFKKNYSKLEKEYADYKKKTGLTDKDIEQQIKDAIAAKLYEL